MDLSRPITDCHEICTQLWCGDKAENLLSTVFLPIPKVWRGKRLIYPQIIEDRRQLEAHNFKTAQHVDKQQMFHLQ